MIVLKACPHHRFLLLHDSREIPEVSSFLAILEARGLSSATRRAYAFDLLCFSRFLEHRHLTIHRLRPKHALDFLFSLRSSGAAPKTINRRITAVRLYLNAQRPDLGNRIFAAAPSSFYKGRRNKALLGPTRVACTSKTLHVKMPRKLFLPIPGDVLRRFFTTLRSFRDQAIASLMLLCGLRSIEVIGLKMHDIDLARSELRILGKGGKERVCPLASSAKTALERYLAFERPHFSSAECFLVLKGSRRGAPMKPETVRKIFRHRRAIPEFKDAHPHRFRHTFCTSLIREKVPLPIVQKLMGHADIDTTLLYTHLSLEDINADYQRAMELISKEMKLR